MRLPSFPIVISLFVSLLSTNTHAAVTVALTSDQQLETLQDPDARIDLSTSNQPRITSLREICEEASRRGDTIMYLVVDEFFQEFRKDEGTDMNLRPDMDEYIDRIKTISDFAGKYRIGLGLGLLSPLEIGKSFIQETGEKGRWVHYQTGYRDPVTGRFSIQMWRQLYWNNNKGEISLELAGVRAFAFRETELSGGRDFMVDPGDIHEITSGIEMEHWTTDTVRPRWEPESTAREIKLPVQRLRVHHRGNGQLKGYDRVFILVEYETPEMDYFSPRAIPWLRSLMKKYHDRGVNLVALSSREMHIQQDWYYYDHHDKGQLSVRYLTGFMADTFAKKYGEEFRDMDKYMLYFAYGPKYYSGSVRAPLNTRYVMGSTPQAAAETMLFRHRYYQLLNHRVVDMLIDAKSYAESLYGHEIFNRAHSTWAESPTISWWEVGGLQREAYQYEYTSNFLWSNAVQQAASACYDYFKWGEYLQPTGNDFPECGWADRNYYGAAMAASVGVLNKYRTAYSAFWGMPEAVQERKWATNRAFGCSPSSTIQEWSSNSAFSQRASDALISLTGNAHRETDVLIIYPMNLVAAEERFGSWITQYGYANYISSGKLMEEGRITAEGKLSVTDRTYTTLVVLYEVLPPAGLVGMIHKLSAAGGNVLWFGPPPLINGSGSECLDEWQHLFGVDFQTPLPDGEIATGKKVAFEGVLEHVAPQLILTDFLVDRIYPVSNREDGEMVAKVDGKIIGVKRVIGEGAVFYLGFRPRDDQSASLGYETRTLFEILAAAGAYPPTGIFPDVNDNTDFVSRTSPCLVTRFPNGSTMITSHYRDHRENWPDGFGRNRFTDSILLESNPLPSDRLELDGWRVNGHEVSYHGRLTCAFQMDDDGHLAGFYGMDCKEILIDQKHYRFSETELPLLVWAPVKEDVPGLPGTVLSQITIGGSGTVSLPIRTEKRTLGLFLKKENGAWEKVYFRQSHDQLSIRIGPDTAGKTLYLVTLD